MYFGIDSHAVIEFKLHVLDTSSVAVDAIHSQHPSDTVVTRVDWIVSTTQSIYYFHYICLAFSSPVEFEYVILLAVYHIGHHRGARSLLFLGIIFHGRQCIGASLFAAHENAFAFRHTYAATSPINSIRFCDLFFAFTLPVS